jgi:hypothetical protein
MSIEMLDHKVPTPSMLDMDEMLKNKDWKIRLVAARVLSTASIEMHDQFDAFVTGQLTTIVVSALAPNESLQKYSPVPTRCSD